MNDVKSSNNHIDNIKELITYSKDKNNKSKIKYKNHETLTAILKSFDTFVIIATTSSSITLSVTGFGWIVIPISTGISCGLSVSNKVIYEAIINKNIKNKELTEKDQQTKNSFDNLYRKSLQDIVIDKNEYESLCKIFTKHLDETKNESFL